jgi:uncharacterized protein (DUF1499 family)
MAPTTEPRSGRGALILGCIAAAAFIFGPLATYLGLAPPLVGFGVFALGGILGLVTLVVALVTLFRAGFNNARGGLALGALITVVFLMLALPSRGVPRINDITTDTQNPPKFVQAMSEADNAGRDMNYPGESFATQQASGYPQLTPLRLPEAPAAVYERVVQKSREMPQWTITRTDAAAFAVEGFATSALFRFKDDFIIEVRPDGTGSAVHMRSKSRVGRGDVGANAARIEAFFAKLRS